MGSLGHGRIVHNTQLVMSLSMLRLGVSGSAVSLMSPPPQGRSLLTGHHSQHVGSSRLTLETLGTLLSRALRTLGPPLSRTSKSLTVRETSRIRVTALALSNRHSTTPSPRAS